ncbi:MAG: uncharacterized protein KVP18_001570 [Porospora cf. gigantea A]|uniref:uncharacterized protein n=1 Tax=Porospora cf. gigantea A TaxID=2853593 RepID=UPI003559C584|nr:MAG: hypothetical protein KVP18_001570 [Porospora cf. gigantea A]
MDVALTTDGRHVHHRRRKIGAITEHLLDAEDDSSLLNLHSHEVLLDKEEAVSVGGFNPKAPHLGSRTKVNAIYIGLLPNTDAVFAGGEFGDQEAEVCIAETCMRRSTRCTSTRAENWKAAAPLADKIVSAIESQLQQMSVTA